jgi:CRISPR/Cas system CMR-associated protein Cmr3 (group 5 of RAMP superfamily)
MYRQYHSTDVETTGHSPNYAKGKYTRTNGLVEFSKLPITTDVTVKAWDLSQEANKQIFKRILRII